MGNFAAFSNRLPDPAYSIEETGKGGSGTAGPGFASVSLESNQPVAFGKTNSGRVTTRSIAGHNWKIKITYNPMTRAQFEPVYSFLQEKRGRLKPFEVVLPQYSSPQSAITVASGSQLLIDGNILAGATSFKADNHSHTSNGSLKPGDMFNFSDPANSNHKKVYQVTRVLNNTHYLSGGTQPAADERIYYVTPSIEKAVTDTENSDTPKLVTTNPIFRVVQSSDVISYSLNTNNLYEFSLNLEEVQV
tara:strand:- start:7989 stop:8729 length:741 start_codon:yes stop_codon:yes gene_type:complete